MESAECPYCAEEIKADVMICKHCHERLSWTREEMVMEAVFEQIRVVVGSPIAKPSVSACGALCHTKYRHDKARLNQCLDDCKIASVIAPIAAKLQRELIVTFTDIIWGGGDIDPLYFEESVRERFSGLGKP